MRPERKKRLAIAGALFLSIFALLFVFHDNILNRIAHMLVYEDKIQPSDAIVVLVGDRSGERMATAIDLYKKGYGKRIFFWGGKMYWKVTHAELFSRQMDEAGIPKSAVSWMEEELAEGTTRGEARENIRMMKQDGANSFIVVTSPYHTARAAKIYKRLAEENGMKAYIYPARNSDVRLTEWWKDFHSTKLIYYEISKTVYYWFH